MDSQVWYSSGEAAEALGISRDALLTAFRSGAREPSSRVGGRRLYSEADLRAVSEWFQKRGRIHRLSVKENQHA